MRTRILAAGTALLAGAATVAAFVPANAADPASGTLTPTSGPVTWEGGPFLIDRPGMGEAGCLSPADPTCDHFELTIDTPGPGYTVTIEVEPRNGVDDLDLHIFDAEGNRIAAAQSPADGDGAVESVTLADPPAGVYTVSILPYQAYNEVEGFPGQPYDGTATYHAGTGGGDDFDGLVETLDGIAGGIRIDSVTGPCDGFLLGEPAPVYSGVRGVTDDGAEIDLDVHLLLDGITPERALGIAEKAKESYRENGINLQVVSWDDTFDPPSAGIVNDINGGKRGSITIDDLFAESRQHVVDVGVVDDQGRGIPPAGADIVFAMTDKEIGEDTDGNGTVDDLGVLGVANCIGAVGVDHMAFGIGEAFADNFRSVPSNQNNASVIVFAHEVGHLLGAHHHYGECATGQRPHESNPRVDPKHPCTLMFPYAGPNNLPFSGLNTAVVREHANRWARP